MDTSGNISESNVPAFRLIEHQLRQVRELIDRQLTVPVKAESIKPLLTYVNTRSGKMIRPGLFLLSYRVPSATLRTRVRDASSGKNTQNDTRDTQSEVIQVAAIIELIHNATLLHDDVIDEGQKRRGLPTINSLWGNESAVLLGDFLLSQVFKICTNLESEISNMIATTTARMCKGELRQVIERRNWLLDESEYIEIITEKSAAFFSCCCQVGAVLAKGTEAQIRSLAYFGLNFGIAFQIIDDLLDITGDENQTGKTAGSDVAKNKLTLAVIDLLRKVGQKEKQRIYKMLDVSAEGIDTITAMLNAYGSLEYAQNRAQEYVNKAIDALNNLMESRAKKALIETARFITSRTVKNRII